MDNNLEMQLKGLQSQMESLNNSLIDAKNKKIATKVKLQSLKEEYEADVQQLMQMTGLSNMEEIDQYIKDKHQEVENMLNDVNEVIKHISPTDPSTFTEEDVKSLKAIVEKYNIPITGE